jgi:hypothetical protein
MLLGCTASLLAEQPRVAQAATRTRSGPFSLRNYSGKCLTYGAVQLTTGAPTGGTQFVHISDCARGASSSVGGRPTFQQIFVEEINDRHEVVLLAGNRAIGVAGGLAQQARLELQEYSPNQPPPAAQLFALDGDSIILVADRELVVEVRNGRGSNGTLLALGNRDLEDSEFWEFSSLDGWYRKPTSGFVRVPQEESFQDAVIAASWGDVIEVDPGFAVTLTDHLEIAIRAGVTIRGNRRSLLFGPEIFGETFTGDPRALLVIEGDHVRVTGMRLRGPTRQRPFGLVTFGIRTTSQFPISGLVIDHNDLSDWTGSAVEVAGPNGEVQECRDPGNPPFRILEVRVVRNFIHNNLYDSGFGYGVSVGGGAYASIDSNTFLNNRHSIAGDGTALSGYSAWYNLILSRATELGENRNFQQDFDMHGSDGGYGPPAGNDLEIVRNTFLGTNRDNFFLRGEPCDGARFHNNIVRNDISSAIKWCNEADCDEQRYSSGIFDTPFPDWLDVVGNRWESPDPTRRLGVGDFDGDGKDDVFLATGQAWYFAPAGKAEWRYLNPKTEEIGDLLFGDFDADGRTDVFTKDGRDWVVSWAGASSWEKINEHDAPLSKLAIGDFNGDRRADVFYADGAQWSVSYGGVGQFTYYAVSSYEIPDLRFGDFDGDRKTDVFGVESGQWKVVYDGTEVWAPLRPALTTSVAGLVVADFNGNGRSDVAKTLGSFDGVVVWQVSYDGTGNWVFLRTADVGIESVPAIGRFDDNPGADVLLWFDRRFDIASSGAAASVRQSRQDMR